MAVLLMPVVLSRSAAAPVAVLSAPVVLLKSALMPVAVLPPPVLLVCLNRRSRATSALHANGAFCVNTLRAGEEAIADAFAGRTAQAGAERFSIGEWLPLVTGSPTLASAVVALDCRIVEVKAVATHNLFIAAVEAIRHGPDGPALVYHDRAYKRV